MFTPRDPDVGHGATTGPATSAPQRTHRQISGARIAEIDALRGIAVLLILPMNIVAFGLASAAYHNLAAAGSSSAMDWIVGALGEVLVDQKWMGVFSLLFGAGVVMFSDRIRRKGGAARRLTARRYGLLGVIGVLHTLVWDGDILLVYALCAPVVLTVRHARPRTLLVAGIGLTWLSAAAAVLVQVAIGPEGVGLGSLWFVGAGEMSDLVGSFVLLDAFARSLGMMLVGVWCYRVGLLDGTATDHEHRLVVRRGLAIGLPFAVAGLLVHVVGRWDPSVALLGTALNTLSTPPVTLAFASLGLLWSRRGTGSLGRRLEAVGRMALTNYLAQTVCGMVVLRVLVPFGSLGRAELSVVVLAVWIAQVWWSDAWLRVHRYGPVEWLWRSATYRAWQPLSRRQHARSSPAGVVRVEPDGSTHASGVADADGGR